MNRCELQKKLDAIGVPRNYYCLKGFDVPYCFLEGYVLDNTSNQWESYLMNERGTRTDFKTFDSEDNACDYFFSKVCSDWDLGKQYWRGANESLLRLLDCFKSRNIIDKYWGRYLYKWKIYPIYLEIDKLVTYIFKKYPDASISKDGDEKIVIKNDYHTIIIHEQNGKWYVLNMFFNNNYGLIIVDNVMEVCLATCYYLFYEKDLMNEFLQIFY